MLKEIDAQDHTCTMASVPREIYFLWEPRHVDEWRNPNAKLAVGRRRGGVSFAAPGAGGCSDSSSSSLGSQPRMSSNCRDQAMGTIRAQIPRAFSPTGGFSLKGLRNQNIQIHL